HDLGLAIAVERPRRRQRTEPRRHLLGRDDRTRRRPGDGRIGRDERREHLQHVIPVGRTEPATDALGIARRALDGVLHVDPQPAATATGYSGGLARAGLGRRPRLCRRARAGRGSDGSSPVRGWSRGEPPARASRGTARRRRGPTRRGCRPAPPRSAAWDDEARRSSARPNPRGRASAWKSLHRGRTATPREPWTAPQSTGPHLGGCGSSTNGPRAALAAIVGWDTRTIAAGS